MSPDGRTCKQSVWGEGKFSWIRVRLGTLSPHHPNRDVLCGFLLCVNISGAPRLGDLGGDISSVTFYHQGKELDCRYWRGPRLGKGRLRL